MILLALDTATEACSVALQVGGERLVDHRVEPRRHARLILPMIDTLLAEAGIARSALDGVAFGRGPGSFTGVRVAAAVVQGIALGLDRGVVGVSTLRTIAEGCRREHGDTAVGVALDARLDEVYWGAFVSTSNGPMLACVTERACAPEAIAVEDAEHGRGDERARRESRAAGREEPTSEGESGPASGGPGACRPASGGPDRRTEANEGVSRVSRWHLAGAGAERYAETLTATLGLAPDAVRAGRLPNAHDTLALALPEALAGRFSPPESAVPVYLRERVALTEEERRASGGR